jgi:hypothetical protein
MFAGQPQPVEIHHRGIWYSGELIGWRHESGGRVSARVRCRIDRLRHSAWVDLGRLRLPDPAHPPRSEPYPAPLPRDVENQDQAEATRPHAMLAGLSSRPVKPAHATTPPAAGYEPSDHDQPSYEPPSYEPSTYEPAYEPYEYASPHQAPEYEAPTYEAPTYETPTYETPTYEAPEYEPSTYWSHEPAPDHETTAQQSTADDDWGFERRRGPRRNEQLRKRDAYLSVL